MSEEEFFGTLMDKASRGLNWELANCGDGIDATIEALKEMMVGEARRAIVYHQGGNVDPFTILRWGTYKWWLGEEHIGTDGEEVVVMVFRLS